MRKFLLFILIIVSTLYVKAQTYSFESLTASDFTNISSNGALGTYTMDNVAGPAVSYTASDLMTLTIKTINFGYKNSSNKSNIFKTGTTFLQTDGKNVEIYLSNIVVGKKITINVSAKGSTNAIFSATGATIDSPEIATTTGITNAEYFNIVMTATASDVTIKETNGGYRIKSLVIETASTTAVPQLLANKGVFFDGVNVVNENGLKLSVFDITGKLIQSSDKTMSTRDFSKGIYILRVEGITGALKFVK